MPMLKSLFILFFTACSFITANCQVLYTFPFDHDAFTDKTISFSPDCKFLATGDNESHVILYNLTNGKEEYRYEAHGGQVICVKFNPDGNIIASGGKDGTIKIYDFQNKKDLITINAHKKAVMCLSFSPDGTKLFSGSRDNTVKVWDITSGKELLSVDDIKGNVRSIRFNPDGRSLILATSALMKGIRYFDLKTRNEILTLNQANTQRIDISSNALFLAAASLDKKIVIWDIVKKSIVFTLDGHMKYVSDVIFSPGGKMLASCSDDQNVILWNVEKQKIIHTFIGHTKEVKGVAYSNDGTMLASCSWDKTIKVWNLKPYKNEMVDETPVNSIGVQLDAKENETMNTAYKNLNFETGSAVITKSSFASLDELAILLKTKTELILQVDGHTDNVGTSEKNLELSKQRADAVKKYLTGKGVEENRITANGYGYNRPIADNSTEEGRKKNRRVEFKVLLKE